MVFIRSVMFFVSTNICGIYICSHICLLACLFWSEPPQVWGLLESGSWQYLSWWKHMTYSVTHPPDVRGPLVLSGLARRGCLDTQVIRKRSRLGGGGTLWGWGHLCIFIHYFFSSKDIDTGPTDRRTQKLKTNLLRTQSSKISPFKPGAGTYIAMHATPVARDSFLANFYPYGPFTWIFFQKLSRVFPVLTVANTGSCVGP